MAERRMFSKDVTESFDFEALPSTTQLLYYRLSMDADDDGFIRSVAGAISACHADQSDFETLVEKCYLLRFPSGLCVIRHWQINNSIRRDRYRPTSHQDEMAQLETDEGGAYRFIEKEKKEETEEMAEQAEIKEKVRSLPKNPWYPQYRLGEESLDKSSLAKQKESIKRARADRVLSADAKRVLSQIGERARAGDSRPLDDVLRRAILEGDEPMYAALSGLRGGLCVSVPPGA